MVTITVQGSAKEVQEELRSLVISESPVSPAKASKSAPIRTAAPSETVAVTPPPAVTIAPATPVATAAVPTVPSWVPALADLTTAITSTVKRLGKKDQVIALLTEFGATRGSELKPEQYTPFLTKLNALV